MNIFLKTLFSSINSFRVARLMPIVLKSVIISLILLVGLSFLFRWGLEQLVEVVNNDTLTEWRDFLANLLGFFFFLLGGWLLLPIFMVVVAPMFEEKIIRNIEIYQYKVIDTASSRSNNFMLGLWQITIFALIALTLNLLVLPFYLVGVGVFITFLLNAYLLGKEYFNIVCNYYVGNKHFKEVWRENNKTVLLHGTALALFGFTPILNLLIPVLGVTWMTHLCRNLGLSNYRKEV